MQLQTRQHATTTRQNDAVRHGREERHQGDQEILSRRGRHEDGFYIFEQSDGAPLPDH